MHTYIYIYYCTRRNTRYNDRSPPKWSMVGRLYRYEMNTEANRTPDIRNTTPKDRAQAKKHVARFWFGAARLALTLTVVCWYIAQTIQIYHHIYHILSIKGRFPAWKSNKYSRAHSLTHIHLIIILHHNATLEPKENVVLVLRKCVPTSTTTTTRGWATNANSRRLFKGGRRWKPGKSQRMHQKWYW